MNLLGSILLAALLASLAGCTHFTNYLAPGALPGGHYTRPEDTFIGPIEFLKTPVGKISAEHPDWSIDVCYIISTHKLFFGMTPEMVLASWGSPDHIKVSQGEGQDQTSWIYDHGDTIIKFHGGLYTSFDELKTGEDPNQPVPDQAKEEK
jgi:hypothetical protein